MDLSIADLRILLVAAVPLLVLTPLLVRYQSLAQWIGAVALTVLLMIGTRAVMRWDVVGVGARSWFDMAFVAAPIFSSYINRALFRPPLDLHLSPFRLAPSLVFIAVAGGYAWGVTRPPPCEGRGLSITDPLPSSDWFVGQGGEHRLLNGHRVVRAQRYAYDIVALGPGGRRARGLIPSDLEAYEIHGDPVHAPCGGRVAVVEAGRPDQPIGEMDREHPAGNHLILHCGGRSLLLAHLQPGSIGVEAGQRVEPGEPVARVGNSGNSSEPHLHIHAVEGEWLDLERVLFSGEPVRLRIQGRCLKRGDLRRAPRGG